MLCDVRNARCRTRNDGRARSGGYFPAETGAVDHDSQTMLESVKGRLQDNLSRIDNLVRIYDELSPPTQGRRPRNATDILRAAVVLLHASIEDFMRGVLEYKLPKASAEVIDGIPLVGTSHSSMPSKFLLGSLVGHQAKTVEELITESVNSYLQVLSFNSTHELAYALKRLGLPVEDHNSHFGDLDKLIRRRHHIVHQADKKDVPGRGHHAAKSIGKHHINSWKYSVEHFCGDVLGALEIPAHA